MKTNTKTLGLGPRHILATLLVLASLDPATALANPAGETTIVGTDVAVDRTDPANVQIQTFDPNTVVNWTSFDIGRNESVLVIQPSDVSRLVNQIQAATPTEIAGSLRSVVGDAAGPLGGAVFIINPAGVVFRDGAAISVPSLIVAGANPGDAGEWDSDGTAITPEFALRGGVQVDAGALIGADAPTQRLYLLGLALQNAGIIDGSQGFVVLAAGDAIAIGNPSSDVLVNVDLTSSNASGSVTNAATGEVRGGAVALLGRNVDNQGRIESAAADITVAVGESVEVTDGIAAVDAAPPSGTASPSVPFANTGSIEARTGSVRLVAGDIYSLAFQLGGGVVAAGTEVVADTRTAIDGTSATDPDAVEIEAPAVDLTADGGMLELDLQTDRVSARSADGDIEIENLSDLATIEQLRAPLGSVTYRQRGTPFPDGSSTPAGVLLTRPADAASVVAGVSAAISTTGSIRHTGPVDPVNADIDCAAGGCSVELQAGTGIGEPDSALAIGVQTGLDATTLSTTAGTLAGDIHLDLEGGRFTTETGTSKPGVVAVSSPNDLILGDATAALSITAHAGTDGSGNLGIDQAARIAAPAIRLEAGDGSGGASGAVVGYQPGHSLGDGSGGSPDQFSQVQDGNIEDAQASFAATPAGVEYLLESRGGSVAIATAASVTGSDLTLTGNAPAGNDVDIDASIQVNSLTVNGDAAAQGDLLADAGITLDGSATLDGAAAQRIDAGSATLDANGSITKTTPGSLTLAGDAGIDADATVQAQQGSLVVENTLTAAGDLLGGQGIQLAQTVTLDGAAAQRIDAGSATLDASGSITKTGGSLVLDGAELALAGDVSGAGVTLDANAVLDGASAQTIDAGAGRLEANGSIRKTSGSLLLRAGTDVDLGGDVSGGEATLQAGDRILFTAPGPTQTVESTGNLTLSASGAAQQFAPILRPQGDLALESSSGTVETSGKLTVADGDLEISGDTVRIADLNAAGTLRVSADRILMTGRSAGASFGVNAGSDAATTTDLGPDYNASRIDFSVMPEAEVPSLLYTFGTPSGSDVSATILGAPVLKRQLSDGSGFDLDPSVAFGPDRNHDVTPKGLTTETQTTADVVPTLADLAISDTVPALVDTPGGTTGPVRADDMIVFLQCVPLEGDPQPVPEDCPEEFREIATVPGRGAVEALPAVSPPPPGVQVAQAAGAVASVAVARPLGHRDRPATTPQVNALRIYRSLRSEPVEPVLEQAVATCQRDSGSAALEGAALRACLEQSPTHAQALVYLNDVRDLLGELRVAGMTPPQFLRAARKLLEEMSPSNLPAAELGIAAEAGQAHGFSPPLLWPAEVVQR